MIYHQKKEHLCAIGVFWGVEYSATAFIFLLLIGPTWSAGVERIGGWTSLLFSTTPGGRCMNKYGILAQT